MAVSTCDASSRVGSRISARGPPGWWLSQFGQDGQAERGGFAGAGLRAADDVAARQHERDGAKLNGRRIHVTHRFDAIQDSRRKT